MLRKLLLTLSLFFLIQVPVFGYTDSSGFESGECDYERFGMRCGQGGCATNERCTWDAQARYNGQLKPNPLTVGLDLQTVYVGKCVSTGQYPCSDDDYSSELKDAGCNTYCSSGFRADLLFDLDYKNNSLYKVSDCYAESIGCGWTFDAAGLAERRYYQCVVDTSCSVQNSGCNYDVPASQSGCASGEECWETPIYDAGGNRTGSIGTCVTDTGTDMCALPNDVDYYCSSANTGCALGTYCRDGGFWGDNMCFDVSPSIPSPATCFSSVGQSCGRSIVQSDSFVPSNWTKDMYCTSGNYCASYNSSTQHYSIVSSSDYLNYPSSGTCITCSATNLANPEGASCTGLLSGTSFSEGALDDCCNENFKCGADKKCHRKPTYSFCSGEIPSPGSVCNIYEDTLNYCDRCPVSINGETTRTDAAGNTYCLGITYAGSAITSGCTDDCGCAGGSCNNGFCVSESSCVSPGDTCTIGGLACCSANEDVPYTCNSEIIGGITLSTCSNPQCEQVAATLQCTEATESCCPDNKPFCNGGTCGEAFECESEGECCPGYGMVCTNTGSSLACQQSSDGECELEDNVLPPAPAYLGPQIEIPQLFSAIGAILYPAGIGIGLFFIVRAGYIIMMSEGSPDEVKKGQEYLTSAVIGTLFIVLSGSILRIIINTLLG